MLVWMASWTLGVAWAQDVPPTEVEEATSQETTADPDVEPLSDPEEVESGESEGAGEEAAPESAPLPLAVPVSDEAEDAGDAPPAEAEEMGPAPPPQPISRLRRPAPNPSPAPAPGVDGARFADRDACRAWMKQHTDMRQRMSIRRFDARHRRCEVDGAGWVYRDTHAYITLDPVLDPALWIAAAATLGVSRTRDPRDRGREQWDPTCNPADDTCIQRRDPLAAGLTAPVGKWREASDGILYASSAISLLPLLTSRGNAKMTDTIVMAEVMALNLAVTESIKIRVGEPRPYAFADLRDFDAVDAMALKDDLRGEDAWKSYFSGHTSITAASTFGLATLWAVRQRGTKPGWYALPYGLAAGLTAVQGTARVMAMKHDPTDVAVGAISGALIGTLVPLSHAAIARVIDPGRRGRGNVKVTPTASAGGLGVQGVW
jgi:membrane-associated phospholipid phosphatase